MLYLHHQEKISSNTQQAEGVGETTESETSGNESANVQMQVSVATEEHTQMETNQPPVYRVIIIDGMAVVNSVTKTSIIKPCQDFADSFLAIICNMAANCDEVRLMFDSANESQANQGKVHILSHEGQHTHSEHFPEGLSLRYSY